VTVARLIIILSHIPILATAIYAAVCFKQLTRPLRIFAYFVFMSALVQFISLFLWFGKENNMPLLHLYVPLTVLFLAWFYATILQRFIEVKIIWWTALIFLLFSIINSIFFEPLLTFNSNALTIESILIIILTLFTFIALLNDIFRQSDPGNTTSLNWINSGFFIYHSCTLVLFFFGDKITTVLSTMFNMYTWMLHSFLSIIMYTCFFISLWKRPTT